MTVSDADSYGWHEVRPLGAPPHEALGQVSGGTSSYFYLDANALHANFGLGSASYSRATAEWVGNVLHAQFFRDDKLIGTKPLIQLIGSKPETPESFLQGSRLHVIFPGATAERLLVAGPLPGPIIPDIPPWGPHPPTPTPKPSPVPSPFPTRGRFGRRRHVRQ